MHGFRRIVLIALTVGGGVVAEEPPPASAYSDPPASPRASAGPATRSLFTGPGGSSTRAPRC